MAASGRKFLLAIGLILGCTGQEVKVSAPAANGGIGDTTSSGGGKAITLSVTPSLATISVNATVQLMGILRDTLGGALGDLITWSTSNSAVATVNSSGLVTGTGVGTTTINAAGDGAAAISTITVTNVPVATVTVAPALDTLQVGLNQQLTATTRDASNNLLTGRTVGWSSNTVGIATVDAAGLVHAVAPGSATITATSEGKTGTSSIVVVNVPVASVTVAPTLDTLSPSSSVTLAATLRDAGNNVLTGRPVSWASNNPGVATVNGSGYVTAVALGSATITATSGAASGNAGIVVSSVPVASVTITPATAAVSVGGSTPLTATARDSNGNVLSGRVFSWTSSRPLIATVDASGLVRGIVVDTATVTVTCEGKTANAPVNVTIGSLWPNEPAGWTTITDYDVGLQNIPTCTDCSFGTGGWHILNPKGNAASLNDVLGSPLSPPWDGQWTYPTGFTGGSAPATMYYQGLGLIKEVYIGYWWKPSSPWQGHYTNVNKVSFMFAGTGGSGNLSEAIMYGGSTGPWKLRIILEFSTSDIYGNGSRWLVPNVNSDPVVLGQWHRIEIYYKHSTTTTSGDGIVRWWMDGRQQGEYDQVNFVSSGWNMFQFSPTWGGTGDTKTETDHFWFDHVHLSHP